MDTPAFQHLLYLFPQLTLRQCRIVRHELSEPRSSTALYTPLPICRICPHCQADAEILLLGTGAEGYAAIAAITAYTLAPFSLRRL